MNDLHPNYFYQHFVKLLTQEGLAEYKKTTSEDYSGMRIIEANSDLTTVHFFCRNHRMEVKVHHLTLHGIEIELTTPTVTESRVYMLRSEPRPLGDIDKDMVDSVSRRFLNIILERARDFFKTS